MEFDAEFRLDLNSDGLMVEACCTLVLCFLKAAHLLLKPLVGFVVEVDVDDTFTHN